jgi:uncharacterized protein (TIGR00255 family)
MALSSMTGFATASGGDDTARWTWELKSVNGRGLDIRVRYPSGFDALETTAKSAISKALARGSINATLTVERTQKIAPMRVDADALAAALAIAREVQDASGGGPASTDALMAMRGVVVADEPVEAGDRVAARNAAIAKTLDAAIEALKVARAAEGAELSAVVGGLLDDIDALKTRIEGHPARSADAIAARLKQQIARLLEAGGADSLDEGRLYQEAALIATRADVEEEIRRIEAHLVAGRGLLESTEAVGRKFDFLAQEFNREANTICSKANDAELSALGLDLKSTIDRLREQIQNIE